MGLLTTFKQKVKEYQADEEGRAQRRLERARTASEREKARGIIARERMKTKQEIAEAKAALLKAETARKKAAKELRDVGNGGLFAGLQRALAASPAPKKRRRTTARKRTTTATRKTAARK